jgi:D-aspartate ligase
MLGQLSKRPVPAVVVGGSLNALGVTRSLSAAGVPVVVLDTTRQCPAAWSRHSTFVRVPGLWGTDLIDALVRLASNLAYRPVLILTRDESVLAISAARQQIEPLYRIDLPSTATVDALADKAEFHALAIREGLPVPRSLTVRGDTDLDQLSELEPPIVLKPADKTLVLAGLVERTVRADSVTQARAAAAQMLSCAPSIIAQEWVDGPDTEILFTLFACDGNGNFRGIFPGRKLVCSPPAVGSTALCVAAPEVAQELCIHTRRFAERVNYRGLGSLEFKRDSRSKELFIIEPTVGRTDWQEEIATLCGVNLPLLAYQGALGEPAPRVSNVSFAPFAWRSERQVSVPLSLTMSGVRVVDGYFRWSDPLPGAYYYGFERLAMGALRRAFRLTRRTLPYAAEAH